jgi:hypothetical protein
MPAATLLDVETVEMPATARRLDNLLHIRSPNGQRYLHVLEWMGYYEKSILWRLLYYMAWLGQQNPGVTIMGTLVYLTRNCDAGDTLTQHIDGQLVQQCNLHCIRLWEHDAQAALASGSLGMAILSPLMRGADSVLAEQVINKVLQQTQPPQQHELLSLLTPLTERLLEKDRLIQLVGKERVMQSQVISSLVEEAVEERTAEVMKQAEQLKARWQQEQERLREREQAEQQRQELHQTLLDAIAVRFPNVPVTLLKDIWQVKQTSLFHQMFLDVVKAKDVQELEQLFKEHAAAGTNGQ